MSLTQFAMVEELAFLVKDNLPCKHLLLSMEETLVNFLQEDTSLDEVLELEPMNSYNRLLLHRLADIFGFSHQSIGEGDDRHLILKRCVETSIPSILVGDLLWDHDQCQIPSASQQLLRREEDSSGFKAQRLTTPNSLEEREIAYLAARERIFLTDEGETKEVVKPKPRSNPVVAHRMIVHALGRKIKQFDRTVCLRDTTAYGEPIDEINMKENDGGVTETNGSGLLCAESKVPLKSAAEVSPKVAISGA